MSQLHSAPPHHLPAMVDMPRRKETGKCHNLSAKILQKTLSYFILIILKILVTNLQYWKYYYEICANSHIFLLFRLKHSGMSLRLHKLGTYWLHYLLQKSRKLHAPGMP